VVRSVRVRVAVALVALGGCLLAATAMASGAAHRHHRSHRSGIRPSTSTNTGGGPSITLTPSTIKLTGTGAFSASINGYGFPIDMPVTINTSTLDAVCSSAGIRPKFDFGVAIPSQAKAGVDGQWVGSLAGVNCRPGVYAVAVQEQALPYQTFVATLTLTL